MHPLMLLQRILIIAGFLTEVAHKVAVLGVGGHVGAQGALASKVFVADRAGECSLSGVHHNVRV